jgi:hypothetical protein
MEPALARAREVIAAEQTAAAVAATAARLEAIEAKLDRLLAASEPHASAAAHASAVHPPRKER